MLTDIVVGTPQRRTSETDMRYEGFFARLKLKKKNVFSWDYD